MKARAPGPRGHPLWGNSPDYTRDPLGFHVACARDFGDVVSLRLGLVPVVALNHPDLIEEMLVNQTRSLGKGLAFDQMRPLIGNGILSSDGSFWLQQRRLIQPAFHRERLDSCADTMVTDTDRMLASWRDGDVLDVREEMARLTLQIAGHTLFGADVSLEAADVGAALTVALEHFEARLDSWFYLIPYWMPTPGNLRLQRAMRTLDGLVFGMIRERRRTQARRDDVLSLLLEVRDEDGDPMPDRQVRDEAMTLLMAGHETTALALTWAWYLLSQHPEAEAALAAELRQELNGSPPGVVDLPRLPYTHAVVRESLRLYPPAWIMTRGAVEDCEIGGYPIPKGAMVMAAQWSMHRNPRYYEDPLDFIPERWLDGLADRLPRFAYFPFGGGPRQCIGYQFAMMETVLVLATIAQHFRLRRASSTPLVPRPAITLRPEGPVRMVLSRAAAL